MNFYSLQSTNLLLLDINFDNFSFAVYVEYTLKYFYTLHKNETLLL